MNLKLIKNKRLLLFLCLFIIFLVYNIITPYIADDFGYLFIVGTQKRLKSISDIFVSQATQYFTTNGRVISHFFVQLFMMINKSIFNLVNALSLTLYFVLINSFTQERKSIMIILISVFCFFLFMPAIGQTVFWLTGSINYLWGTIIILACIYPYIKWMTHQNLIFKNFIYFYILIIGFIAGATSENTSIALICAIVFILLYRLIKKENITTWSLLGLLSSCVGFIFMIKAPGNSIRLASAGTRFSLFEMIKRIPEVTQKFLFTENLWILIILILIINFFLYRHNKKGASFLSIFFFVAALLANYAMVATPTYPDRTMFGCVTFLLISLLIGLSSLDINNKLLKYGAILCFINAMIFTLLPGTYEFLYISLHSYQRDLSIKSQIKAGNTEITGLEYIGGFYKLNPKTGLEDISEDYTFWVNYNMSLFYNVNTITAEHVEREVN